MEVDDIHDSGRLIGWSLWGLCSVLVYEEHRIWRVRTCNDQPGMERSLATCNLFMPSLKEEEIEEKEFDNDIRIFNGSIKNICTSGV